MSDKQVRVITFGTFDLLHEGHLRILQRAKEMGDYLIVGVSSDQLNYRKGKRSIFPEQQRLSYTRDLKYVDEVFLEESLEKKDDYIHDFQADLLVMGNDWEGKFDWVSCNVHYLPRTEGVSSTLIKDEIKRSMPCNIILFPDTHIEKHYDCALSIVDVLTKRNIAPIFLKSEKLPINLNSDALAYFNEPRAPLGTEYQALPRVLIDHGASHLKWFLGSRNRFHFFDLILTAGPDHVRSLECIFDGEVGDKKIRPVGFIKSESLLSAPAYTHDLFCEKCGLDPAQPIVAFLPTWHKTAHPDIIDAVQAIAAVENHIVSYHPETSRLPTSRLRFAPKLPGITTEVLKHADIVISDVSSTIYEAAALGKTVVQLLLREYPDNPATLYDFPQTAGIAESFCGGVPVRPSQLAEVLANLASDPDCYRDLVSACQKRLLAGTFIAADSADWIADQLVTATAMKPDPTLRIDPATAPAPARTLVQRNKFFAAHRIIAHAGGRIDGTGATNSREAIIAALGQCPLIELDFVLGADGAIVAHDGLEEHYGLTVPFDQVPVETMRAARFDGKLTSITPSDAIALVAAKGGGIVCDIKAIKDGYERTLQEIHGASNAATRKNNIIVQCYCLQDFAKALELGFTRTILAAWKYFHRDPLGEPAFEFIRGCIEINANAVTGLSIPYTNKHMPVPSIDDPRFPLLHAFWKRVFVHGAPPARYSEILLNNCGLYAQSFSEKVEFGAVPGDFNWQHYLFLNPDLIEKGLVTEVDAVTHYMSHGRSENRACQYNLPEGFKEDDYIRKNPQLQDDGISGGDSARAHWTRSGSRKGLKWHD